MKGKVRTSKTRRNGGQYERGCDVKKQCAAEEGLKLAKE